MTHHVPEGCRARLGPRDVRFVAAALAGGDSVIDENETLLESFVHESDSLDAFLDDPKVLEAVIRLAQPVSISAELYFYVLVRHHLKEAGIDDIRIADYVAGTLADYAYGVKTNGVPPGGFSYHVDFLAALDGASRYEQFYLHVGCGNQFMMLTGLFPRFIEHRRERRGAPGIRYYESLARDAFHTASAHPLAGEFGLRDVYHDLADIFPQTRRVLNRLAREFLFLGA